MPKPKKKVVVSNFPKSFDIDNFPKQNKNISVDNFPEFPKPVKEVKISNLFSIKGIKDRLDKLINKQNEDVDLDDYTSVKKPLAVRLVKNDKSSFYESRGGSGGGNYATPEYGPKELNEVDSVGIASDHYDEVTRAIKTIEYEHHEIHEGRSYYAQIYDNDLDDTGSLIMRLITPNTPRWVHLNIVVNSSLGGVFYLFENPTFSTDGTARVEYNRDRNSTNNATLEVFEKPAITANGTLLQTTHIGTDGKKGSEGSARGENEWILKQNEEYMIMYTSHSDNNKVRIGINWYEHINKTN